MKKVSLNDIRIDGGTQGRILIDQPTVYSYIESMKNGDIFPPMLTMFDGTTHWLVDGFHRYHAYKILGMKDVSIDYKAGTQEEAQVMSFGVNGKHGKPRTNEDKRKVVEAALEHPLTKDKSSYEIAKICDVSQPFVAGIRDPEKKKKQEESKQRHVVKKAEQIAGADHDEAKNTNQISISDPDPRVGMTPDEDELKANDLAFQADTETLYKLLESNDALKTAHEEIKRLNLLNAQLSVRINGLMGERNEAVKMVKELQKELDKRKTTK
jgi:hypothetical protein